MRSNDVVSKTHKARAKTHYHAQKKTYSIIIAPKGWLHEVNPNHKPPHETRLAQTLRFLTLPALFCAALCPARAEKLFDFGFNESGPFATSAVDAKSQIALVLKNSKGDSADLHGPAGSGVSGKPNDRAFDASSAQGMGKGVGDASDPSRGINYGPVASADEDTGLVSGLESYTIQGWFKADREVLGQVARLVCFSIDGGRSAVMDLGGNSTG
jgi:hypothetical protein